MRSHRADAICDIRRNLGNLPHKWAHDDRQRKSIPGRGNSVFTAQQAGIAARAESKGGEKEEMRLGSLWRVMKAVLEWQFYSG